MNRCARFVLFLAAASSAFPILVPGDAVRSARAAPAQKHLVSLSVPDLHVAAKERVVGFHFEVTSGRIARVRDMPIGWNISVNNDPSWNTTIDASIVVAAAAVDASFFKDFVVIEKIESAKIPFHVEGDVSVSSDFSSSRKLRVQMKDFTVQEEAPPSKKHSSK